MANQNKKLSILILPVAPPYPPDDGGKICVFGFIDYLRKVNEFTVFIPCFNAAHSEQVTLLKKEWPDVAVFHIDLYDRRAPQPPKVSTIRALINFTKKAVRKVKGSSNQPASVPVEPDIFNDINFTTPFYPYPKEYLQKLNEVLDQKTYDIIQVELTRNLNLVNVLPEKSIRIFEQIESRFDVIRDFVESENIDSFYGNYVVKNTQSIENAFMAKYDAVFALNKKDEQYLKTVLPDLTVFTSPFGILNKDLYEPSIGAWTPEKLVFSGNEEHYPNFHALNWYLEEIHAKVNAVISIPLYITGKWSAVTKETFTQKYSNVHFAGYVDDYISFLRNSIMIVPIKLGGGGIRTKILYAMGNGAPVVSTAIGAFGIDVTDKENILLADNADQFAEAVKSLMSNPSILTAVSQNGYKLIKDNYSQTYTSELRNKFYHQLMSVHST